MSNFDGVTESQRERFFRKVRDADFENEASSVDSDSDSLQLARDAVIANKETLGLLEDPLSNLNLIKACLKHLERIVSVDMECHAKNTTELFFSKAEEMARISSMLNEVSASIDRINHCRSQVELHNQKTKRWLVISEAISSEKERAQSYFDQADALDTDASTLKNSDFRYFLSP